MTAPLDHFPRPQELTSMSILMITVATLGTVLACTLYQWLLPKPLAGIAYNPEATQNIFGDGPAMLREISQTKEFGIWCAKQVEKMGSPICQVFVRPFSKPWILLADFRESQDILTRRGKDFDKSSFIIEAMGSLGNFHPRFKTGQLFKASRLWLQDLMTPSFLHNSMGPIIYAKGLELIELFGRKNRLAEERPFSVRADYDLASLDVMVGFSFGKNFVHTGIGPQVELVSSLQPARIPKGPLHEPVEFPEAKIHDFLLVAHEVPQVVESMVVAWLPNLSLWWWRKMPWFKTLFAERERTLHQQIQKATENYRTGEVNSGLEHMLMREMAVAEKDERPAKFDNPFLVDEVFGEIIAGHHTTGGALGWATKFLTAHQDVQTEFRCALRSAIPESVEAGRLPSFEEIRRAKMPYVDAVLEEMLRLTSVTVTRESLQDTQILGRFIPKGTQIFLVSNGPGFLSPSLPVDDADRRPAARAATDRRWDESKDLKQFDPERWLVRKGDEVEFDPLAGPQLGFGLGVRSCWGRRMAMMEVRTIISLLIWHFEMLQIPEALSDFAGFDGVSRRPQKCFVRLREIDR